MTLRRSLRLLALALAAAGCADETVTTTPTGMDAAVADVPVAADVLRVPTGDGGTLALQGAWRVVGYELTDTAASDAGVDGGAAPTRYTDRDMPVRDPSTGLTVGARVNGLLEVSNTTLRLALGVLRDGRFDIAAPGASYVSTYDGSGLFVDSQRFVGGAGMASFRFDAPGDGTLVVTTEGGSARRLILQPEIDAAPVTAGTFALRVRALGATRTAPLAAPRTAIFWELPGQSSLVEDLAEATSMAGAEVSRELRLDAPAIPGVSATPAVAFGHPALYDDVDGNGRFNADRDAMRSVGQLALAWRDPSVTTNLSAVAARLAPGWQVVAVHTRATSGERAPVRLDRATSVPLECVATDAPAGALPDLLP